jgi:threonine/homoserine/homoserine lactone efflux protein
MLDVKLLVAGISMGLAVAAPLGPVNIMVIRETLAHGVLGGIAAGLGSVVPDTAFALIAAFGLHTVADFFAAHATALDLVGGCVLLAIGITTARRPVHLGALEAPEKPSAFLLLRKAFATFLTTLTNPLAPLGIFAVFGGMHGVLRLGDNPWRAIAVTAFFAMGGALWWLAIIFIVSRLKGRLSDTTLTRINRWTGVLIAAFGFGLLMEVF